MRSVNSRDLPLIGAIFAVSVRWSGVFSPSLVANHQPIRSIIRGTREDEEHRWTPSTSMRRIWRSTVLELSQAFVVARLQRLSAETLIRSEPSTFVLFVDFPHCARSDLSCLLSARDYPLHCQLG